MTGAWLVSRGGLFLSWEDKEAWDEEEDAWDDSSSKDGLRGPVLLSLSCSSSSSDADDNSGEGTPLTTCSMILETEFLKTLLWLSLTLTPIVSITAAGLGISFELSSSTLDLELFCPLFLLLLDALDRSIKEIKFQELISGLSPSPSRLESTVSSASDPPLWFPSTSSSSEDDPDPEELDASSESEEESSPSSELELEADAAEDFLLLRVFWLMDDSLTPPSDAWRDDSLWVVLEVGLMLLPPRDSDAWLLMPIFLEDDGGNDRWKALWFNEWPLLLLSSLIMSSLELDNSFSTEGGWSLVREDEFNFPAKEDDVLMMLLWLRESLLCSTSSSSSSSSRGFKVFNLISEKMASTLALLPLILATSLLEIPIKGLWSLSNILWTCSNSPRVDLIFFVVSSSLWCLMGWANSPAAGEDSAIIGLQDIMGWVWGEVPVGAFPEALSLWILSLSLCLWLLIIVLDVWWDVMTDDLIRSPLDSTSTGREPYQSLQQTMSCQFLWYNSRIRITVWFKARILLVLFLSSCCSPWMTE